MLAEYFEDSNDAVGPLVNGVFILAGITLQEGCGFCSNHFV